MTTRHDPTVYEVRNMDGTLSAGYARCWPPCPWYASAPTVDEVHAAAAAHCLAEEPEAVPALAQAIARATDRYEGEAPEVLRLLAAAGWRLSRG